MVRNEAFRWIELLARNRVADLPLPDDEREAVAEALDELWEDHDEILTDAEARSPARFLYDHDAATVTQIVHDDEGIDEWRITARIDLNRSREDGKAVFRDGALVRAGFAS